MMAAVVLLLAGCNPGSGSRPVSMGIWQSQMQTYIIEQANGDMNALRDLHLSPGQPGFRAFSHDRPEQSRDVVGLLIGVRALADRLWYVYLVGDIDREQATAMHLAAVAHAGVEFQWIIGEDSSNSTAAYLAHRERDWRERHGGSDPPRFALGFPSDGDRLSMQATGDTITVRDAASGAQWQLRLTLATGNGRSN